MNKIIRLLILTLFLTKSQIETARFRRASVGPIWPNKKIPYTFSNRVDFDIDDRSTVEHILWFTQNLLAVNGETCIEFVPREDETDYILFIDNGDCSSSVGFVKDVNRISLSKNCITTEVVMHEIMHRLGFDHEHSRHDRDKHISVNFDNIIDNSRKRNDYNFEINRKFKETDFEMSPYDFFSITHYNSDALQKDKNQPTIVSKIPALISKDNKIEIERRYLSNIDIIQIQTLYNCKKIKMPIINKESDEEDTERRIEQSKRFKIEASFLGLDSNLIERYLNKTYETCGMDHYWPADYPLVESDHKHYELNCVTKKDDYKRCLFSIECSDNQAVCNRPFFKKRGWCVNTGYDDLNKINQKINDGIFETGKVIKNKWLELSNGSLKDGLLNTGIIVKDKLVETSNKIKNKWDKFDGDKFQDDLIDETIVVKNKMVETSKKVLSNIEEAGKTIKDSILKILG